MTYLEAFEKGSVKCEITTHDEFKEATAAWIEYSVYGRYEKKPKFEGPGDYEFTGRLDNGKPVFIVKKGTKS